MRIKNSSYFLYIVPWRWTGRLPTQPLRAVVFKTVVDPFVGKVSIVKVVSGTVKKGDALISLRTGESLKPAGMFYERGKEHLDTDEIMARFIQRYFILYNF